MSELPVRDFAVRAGELVAGINRVDSHPIRATALSFVVAISMASGGYAVRGGKDDDTRVSFAVAGADSRQEAIIGTSWSNSTPSEREGVVVATDQLHLSDHLMAQAVVTSSFDEDWYDIDDFETVDY